MSERADVIGPEAVDVLVVTGVVPVGDIVAPGAIPGTTEVLVDDPTALARSLGLDLSPLSVLEALRVAAGIPTIGVDTGARTLVQEAGLTDAVSFDKGCYLGQETVARLHYRGHANRRLCRIALAGAIAPGTDLVWGERAAGTATSVVEGPDGGWLALALVRREVPDGAEVQAPDGTTGRVLGAATSGAPLAAS